MKNTFILFACFCLFVACNKSNDENQTGILEIEGFSLPEGAVGRGDYIYISNVGKEFKPLEKDGDGFISRLSKEGKIIDLNYFPKEGTIHSPKGMVIINNTLYVSDIDRVLGFNLESREKTFELDFSKEKTLLLNDMEVKNDSTLFVSGMDIDKIFIIHLAGDTSWYEELAVTPSLKKPNGLCWDSASQKLYVGMFGRADSANGSRGDIGYVSFQDSTYAYSELTNYQGNIDGVTLYKDYLLFTDWLAFGQKGTLKAYHLKGKTGAIVTVIKQEIDGPGDFYLDKKTKEVWLPKMRENKVIRTKVDLP